MESSSVYFRRAWELFSAHVGVFVGAAVISFIASGIGGALRSSLIGSEGFFVSVSLSVLGYVASAFIAVGFLKLVLATVDGKPVAIGTLLEGSQELFSYIFGSVIFGIAVITGFFFFIIPGIYLALRLSLWPYFLVDRHLSVTDSLTASWNATAPVLWQLLAFGLVVLLVTFVGALALGVGLLVAMPVTSIAQVLVYRALAPNPPSSTSVVG